MVREKAELRRGIIEREEQYYQLKIGKKAVGQLIYFYLVLSSSERVKGLDVKNLSLMTTPPGQKTRAQMIFPYYPQHQQKMPRF